MGLCSQEDSRALLNKGQDNEMEIFGYRTLRWKKALCIAGYIFSFGLLWLIFYWKPEWEVWACCSPCTLQEANIVLLRETDEFKRYSRKKVQWTNVHELTLIEFLHGDNNCIVTKSIIKPEMKAHE